MQLQSTPSRFAAFVLFMLLFSMLACATPAPVAAPGALVARGSEVSSNSLVARTDIAIDIIAKLVGAIEVKFDIIVKLVALIKVLVVLSASISLKIKLALVLSLRLLVAACFTGLISILGL
ncbi:hypothetical protein BDV93DRAFT_573438 [Ceratobasidium sp. AG-I]|nr:hypothetical protein BDV93DRAFT_573438 [Ceratobasidium sp. AG-I]